MADTIIVGKFVGNHALAAVGSTGCLNFLILGFLFGITSGFGVVIAQYFGAKDEEGLKHAVASSITLCIIFTVLLTSLSIILTKPLLHLMNTPDLIMNDAYTYIIIIYAGICFSMIYNMISCILRALGDSKTPLYFLIISSALNIILDLLFIILFSMGVAGAALATIISQGISGLLCYLYARKKFPILRLERHHFTHNSYLCKKHLSIALPMAFQFSITAIGTIILQGALNLFGPVKIAAFTAATKVEQLVTQPAGTFGVAIATYVGQNLGAGRIERIKKGVRETILISLAFSVFASIIVLLFGRTFTSMFLKEYDVEIIKSSMQYLKLIAICFPFLHLLFIYRNALQGMGKSFVPLMAGVSELVLRTLVAFLLPSFLGYTAICLASPIAWIGATLTLYPFYALTMRKLLK
ncbi:multi antimicrobial extrusion protein (Na(+)/drug antiporter), MATE family of MDR efflux pumps [Lachnospiraceae bacterium KM106-2]|nr:multi antimicrobial extrusion protein (Na(+)/drug antiporter), MATE family of MDR efflux pumps [Lachnospiraceae bacterium KM106-2]